MENIRWILLLAGAGVIFGIFLMTWLPGKLRALSGRRRARPSVRARGFTADEAGVNVDGMVNAELEKLGQLVSDDAADEQESPMCEIRATPQQSVTTEKVFSLYVLAPTGVPFRGPILIGALQDAGLEYGDMQIFNRYESDDGEQCLQFSLASVREPGIFDLSAMQDFTTDGLVLFIQLPGQTDAVKAFESMVATARKLAGSLNGTVYDATNSVLTNQTVGFMREEVVTCQMQQRLAKRAS